jgi:catabolite repression HPr-like protein
MVEQQVTVHLKSGLQARPAALFVQKANQFVANITLDKDGKKVNAKSIMGVMSLALSTGVSVTLTADGRDEKEAIDSLVSYLEEQ